jgi:murein DD-endopeptidase MepM/ murein hydrolase activator NlpD
VTGRRSVDRHRLDHMGAAGARRAAIRFGARAAWVVARRALDSAAAGTGTVLTYGGWAARLLVRRVGWRRLGLLLAAPALVAGCCAGLLVAAAVSLLGEESTQQPDPWWDPACLSVAGDATEQVARLDLDQRSNAALIVGVGQRLGAPPRAWIIAVATAMQESGLRNLPHLGDRNDHDSLGLFQQRPSQGWGSAEEILDPIYAATAFYQRLMRIPEWDRLPLTEAAQAVQRSAHPDAYARHEPLAVALVAEFAGGLAGGVAAVDIAAWCGGWHGVTAAGWSRPAAGPVWSGFRTSNRPEHYGIDIGAPRGSVVRAAADGRVIRVECNATLHGAPFSCDADSPLDGSGRPLLRGCGWYLDIIHAGDVVTRYCHLARRPGVAVGQDVAAGQPVGLVGSSGHSSGPHLHFEVEVWRVRRLGSGLDHERRQTDPVAFLGQRGVVLECHSGSADCDPVHGDRVR